MDQKICCLTHNPVIQEAFSLIFESAETRFSLIQAVALNLRYRFAGSSTAVLKSIASIERFAADHNDLPLTVLDVVSLIPEPIMTFP